MTLPLTVICTACGAREVEPADWFVWRTEHAKTCVPRKRHLALVTTGARR